MPEVSKSTLANIKAHNANIDKQVKEEQQAIAAVRKRHETKLRNARLAAIPEADRAAVAVALKTSRQDAPQKALLEKYKAALRVEPKEIDAAITGDDRTETDESIRRIAELNSGRRQHGWIHALYAVGPPPGTR